MQWSQHFRTTSSARKVVFKWKDIYREKQSGVIVNQS